LKQYTLIFADFGFCIAFNRWKDTVHFAYRPGHCHWPPKLLHNRDPEAEELKILSFGIDERYFTPWPGRLTHDDVLKLDEIAIILDKKRGLKNPGINDERFRFLKVGEDVKGGEGWGNKERQTEFMRQLEKICKENGRPVPAVKVVKKPLITEMADPFCVPFMEKGLRQQT